MTSVMEPGKDIEYVLAGPCRDGVAITLPQLQRGEVEKPEGAGLDNLPELSILVGFD